MSVWPHCLCPVTGHIQPGPDECAADPYCGLWVHGDVHRQNNYSTITVWGELGFLLHFFLLFPVSPLTGFSGKPSVYICIDDIISTVKCTEKVDVGSYSLAQHGKDAIWGIYGGVRISSAVLQSSTCLASSQPRMKLYQDDLNLLVISFFMEGIKISILAISRCLILFLKQYHK